MIVLADNTARADFVAADLISQAEHSPGSGVLITWHEPLIEAVKAALEKQLLSCSEAISLVSRSKITVH